MKEVSREDFYEFIGNKNVAYSVEGDYPYTGYWKDRGGTIVAKSVESYPEIGVYPLMIKYYIQL